MGAIATEKKKVPGGRNRPVQPQFTVHAFVKRRPECITTGWDGAGGVESGWIDGGSYPGTIFIEDNGEAFNLDVELIIDPVYDIDGNFDPDASGKYILGNVAAAIGVGGHFNIDVTVGFFRLIAGSVSPTVAFTAAFWKST